ncbi:MAG: enoyl-CoA hydratase-related protein [Actinomycetota bacterium]|nr:enoyl-CoA hydratase-related protein [Actinomycetota bacterium]
MSGEVRLEPAGGVGWVVFDNPSRRNAFTGPMLGQLRHLLAEAADDETVRVVALRGAGEEAFVSGADISAFGSATGVETGPRIEDLLAAFAELEKPVLAVLRGWCLGGGVLLALAADVRLAGDDLRIGIPAARLGVAYPKAGVARLVSVAGPAVAAEMLMSGEPFDAADALRAGLVNRVVPAGSVFEAAQALAERMAANAPLTLTASKRTIAAVLDADPEASEAADRAIAACHRSDDFAEGQRAFAEKRRPVFRGR